MTQTTYIHRVCTTLDRPGSFRSRRARTVRAVFLSLDARALPPEAERHAVLERLAAPAQTGRFLVPWMDDRGRVRVDRGYFAAYDRLPLRGEVLFRRGLTEDEVRCRAFLRMLEGCLCGAGPGLVCGADRDPSLLNDAESMRFCRSFADALRRCVPEAKLPRLGVSKRERGYLSDRLETASPAAPLSAESSVGYGLCCFADEALRRRAGAGLWARRAAILGRGAIALTAAEAALRLGAALVRPEAADVFLLCGDRVPDALLQRRPDGVFEGVPGACGPETAERLRRADVLFAPAVCAGAGASLPPEGRSAWEAEAAVRRGMRALLDRTGTEDLCAGAYTAAVRAAAERLISYGV